MSRNTTCTICLQKRNQGQFPYKPICSNNHAVHLDCALKYIVAQDGTYDFSNWKCPLCREPGLPSFKNRLETKLGRRIEEVNERVRLQQQQQQQQNQSDQTNVDRLFTSWPFLNIEPREAEAESSIMIMNGLPIFHYSERDLI